MGLSESFFGQKFGITETDLHRYLSEALSAGGDYADLYFEYLATSNISIDEGLVKRADAAGRAYDPRVFQVQAMYVDSLRHVMVATSDGTLSFDRQPMTRLSVAVLARDGNGVPQRGYSGGGGRVALEFFLNEKT